MTISAIALAAYPLAFYSSMRLAGVAIGTVIFIATAPFFAVLLECLFSKGKSITKKWLLSFSVGISGIMLLVFSESYATHTVSNLRLIGVLLGLMAGLFYAVYRGLLKH